MVCCENPVNKILLSANGKCNTCTILSLISAPALMKRPLQLFPIVGKKEPLLLPYINKVLSLSLCNAGP